MAAVVSGVVAAGLSRTVVLEMLVAGRDRR
jgi:hypothetical protein